MDLETLIFKIKNYEESLMIIIFYFLFPELEKCNVIKGFDKILFYQEDKNFWKYLTLTSDILSSVNTLNLSNTKVTDVSILGNVNTLNLSNTQVTDVSILGNVNTLNLSNTQVTDVSMLGNVHHRQGNESQARTLNLSFTNVTDVSMLGNVKNLIL